MKPEWLTVNGETYKIIGRRQRIRDAKRIAKRMGAKWTRHKGWVVIVQRVEIPV